MPALHQTTIDDRPAGEGLALLLNGGAVAGVLSALAGVLAGGHIEQAHHPLSLPGLVPYALSGAIVAIIFVCAARTARYGAAEAIVPSLVASLFALMGLVVTLVTLGTGCLDLHANPLTATGCTGTVPLYHLFAAAPWLMLAALLLGVASLAAGLAAAARKQRSSLL